jgi:importin subunit alpha-6/7
LKRQDVPKLQFEAAWCLKNVDKGENEHVRVLLKNGIAKELVKLLATPHLDVIKVAIRVLGNLAEENPTARDVIIAAGAVEPKANLLD